MVDIMVDIIAVALFSIWLIGILFIVTVVIIDIIRR